MKRITALFLSLITSLLFFVSCSSSLINLDYEDGKLIAKKTKVTYTAASLNYSPVSIGDEYAYYKKSDKTFYEIPGLNPKQWITEEDSGSTTTVFYADGVVLPTLSEMNPNKVYICFSVEKTYSVATIDNKKIVNYLVSEYKNGEAVDKPLDEPIYSYELKFHSESKYPYIYYNLYVYKYDDGVYIHDKISKRTVKVEDVFYDYLGI